DLLRKLQPLMPGYSVGQIVAQFKVARSMHSLADFDQLYLEEGERLYPGPVELEDQPQAAA
ncbi:MAG: hypothetical protein AAFN65_03880, partial [Bacteroidota bacterium]